MSNDKNNHNTNDVGYLKSLHIEMKKQFPYLTRRERREKMMFEKIIKKENIK